MSVPSRGSRGVIARTQRWYSPDNDSGSFVPVVAAASAFDPATLDDNEDDDGQQLRATGYPFVYAPDTLGEFVPFVFNPALLDDDIDGADEARWVQPIWYAPGQDDGAFVPTGLPSAYNPQIVDFGWDAQQDRWQPPVWFAPDAEQAPPIIPAILPLDPSLSTDFPDASHQQARSTQPTWYTPPEEWAPTATGSPTPFDPAGYDWGYDPQQETPRTQRWFVEEAEARYPEAAPAAIASVAFNCLVPFHTTLTWTDPAGGSSPIAFVQIWRARTPSAAFDTSTPFVDLVATVAAGVQTYDDYWGSAPFTVGGVSASEIRYYLFGINADGVSRLSPLDSVFQTTVGVDVLRRVPDLWYDHQPFTDRTQRWFAPDIEWAPTATGSPTPFDPATVDWVYDATQERPTTQRWFTPDDALEGLVPLASAYDFATLPKEEQPQLWAPTVWFTPDQDMLGAVPIVVPYTPPTTAQLAGAWQEQPTGQIAPPWLFGDVLLGVSTEDVLGHGCLYDELTALAPGWWARLGETTGTAAVDARGGANGTYVNAPTLGVAAGLANDADTAVGFDGVSDYATFPHGTGLATGDVFSIFLRFKRGAVLGTVQVVMDKGSTGGNSFMVLFGADNKIRLADSATGSYIVRANVGTTDTGWHTAAFTKNGATVKAILDGVDRTETGTPATLATSSDVLTIGAEDILAALATVTLDELAVFPGVVLTQAQAVALHAAVLCDATPAEFVGSINDVQPWASNAVCWFAPEPLGHQDIPRPYDPSVSEAADDWDAQQDRDLTQRWFTPDASVESLTPLASAAPARVDADMSSDPQQLQTTYPRWFSPEGPTEPVFFTSTTAPTTDQTAPLWAEQPYPLAGDAVRWYDVGVEPVSGPLLEALFTTGGSATVPPVLIDAETGDVFLYIGGVFIVKAT